MSWTHLRIILIRIFLGFISTKTFVDLSEWFGETGTFSIYASGFFGNSNNDKKNKKMVSYLTTQGARVRPNFDKLCI